MTALASAAPRFEMGRVASRTFGAIGRNWLVFGAIALLIGAIPYGFLQWLQLGALDRQGGAASVNWWVSPLTIFINLFSSCLIQAALVHGTIVDLNGRRANFGDCLSTGLRYMLPVLGIGILLGLGVMVGLLLLVVPGILMGLAWLVAVPAEVVERTGVTASFGRSADLTRNHRGAILGLIVAYYLIVWIIIAVIGALTIGIAYGAAADGGLRIGMAIFTAAYQAVITMLGATGIASIYYELRSIKEGVAPETLLSVFD
jgi:hypothetical protein